MAAALLHDIGRLLRTGKAEETWPTAESTAGTRSLGHTWLKSLVRPGRRRTRGDRVLPPNVIYRRRMEYMDRLSPASPAKTSELQGAPVHKGGGGAWRRISARDTCGPPPGPLEAKVVGLELCKSITLPRAWPACSSGEAGRPLALTTPLSGPGLSGLAPCLSFGESAAVVAGIGSSRRGPKAQSIRNFGMLWPIGQPPRAAAGDSAPFKLIVGRRPVAPTLSDRCTSPMPTMKQPCSAGSWTRRKATVRSGTSNAGRRRPPISGRPA